MVETQVDKKFINNQNYILNNDLDFNFIPISCFGNMSNPFTGTFDGNNYCMKNIELINNINNGIFGVVKNAIIKNLTIQNVIIKEGNNNGCLMGIGYKVELNNIKIIGNMKLSGNYNSLVCPELDGNLKNISLCCDGKLNNKAALLSYDFTGTCENISIVSNIENNIGIFININGIMKNSNIISFNKIKYPFYKKSKFNQIINCYYFQLNEEELPEMQQMMNSYYRNLNKIIYTKHINWTNWIKINNMYYLRHINNYTNDNIESSELIKFYDIQSKQINIDDYYIDMDKKIRNKDTLLTNPLYEIPILKENILYQPIENTRSHDILPNISNVLELNANNLNQQMENISQFGDYMKNRLDRLKKIGKI
jgi:hypothetical protein